VTTVPSEQADRIISIYKTYFTG